MSDNTTGTPGWHPDPWRVAAWRWWDGELWTAQVHQGPERKPRLPAWLSPPIVAAAPFAVLLTGFAAVNSPTALLLGLVPLAIVLPTLMWLDSIEPEPRAAKVHAVLWGATVAGVVSVIVNTMVALLTNLTVATVIGAPLVEEGMKGLGVYWALRRREIDGVMDGIIYAGLVALGFAVVEDVFYFSDAADSGVLVPVFILRALLTPFAHPLFTSWIGVAVGLAVYRRQSVAVNALWGYGLAFSTHAAWNGSLTYAAESGAGGALMVAAGCFVLLFLAAVITVVRIRHTQRREFTEVAPALARRYGLSDEEAQVFHSWPQMRTTRRRLSRPDRARFDAVRAALARLAMLHFRPGPTDPADELRLVEALQSARH
ncbi:MAG: PrsW family glutamic-type intramembrane protease [Acidimicrobiales bacterium]